MDRWLNRRFGDGFWGAIGGLIILGIIFLIRFICTGEGP
jgi:hypothetical protein